jgi:hypothetical protein
MQLLSEITVTAPAGKALVQLLQGDLSTISPEHATDILVISAFPGDYTALQGSLIYDLDKKGLSVAKMAANKDTDLRSQLSCWLSKPLSAVQQQQFNIKNILCFEPGNTIQEAAEVVGNIFRCINTFVFDDDYNVVAMPIIATGYQRVPMQKILPALLQASVFWLQNGLPLDIIKLVVYRDQQAAEALPIFTAFKNSLKVDEKVFTDQPKAPQSGNIIQQIKNTFFKKVEPAPARKTAAAHAKQGYDYFLSYAHVHSKEIQSFVEQMQSKNKALNVFYDRDSIPPGGLWLQQISKAIQQSDKVLVFLSPDYDNSPVCWDEFQCAKLMEYNRKKSIIQTIYLYGYTTTEMPLVMGINSYIDCREGCPEKLAACVQQLLK